MLTPEQAEELREHLAAMIPETHPEGADLEAAVAAIDFAAFFCASSVTSAADWRQARKAVHDHQHAVAATAAKLRELLAVESPAWGSGVRGTRVDWPALAVTLDGVAEAARETDSLSLYRPQVGAGAPPDDLRDKLISVIYSVYPPGTATKSRDSHAEQTVEMVLGYLGRELENVHSLILDALRRQPPFDFATTTNRAK